MSFWRPKNLVLISATRISLLAAAIHLGQIVYGAFAGIDDGPTHVGFPFVFASWSGGVCFGACSTFRALPLLGTLAFWIALVFGAVFVLRAKQAKHSGRNA
jgi:hypothetical protein